MALFKALESRDLPLPRQAPGGFSMPAIRRARVAGRDVLVTRLGTGEVVAFATHCPHQGTPLDTALLVGDQLRCSQHNYVYDPSTGHNVRPSLNAKSDALFRLKPGYLPTFKVEEKQGWIWISEDPKPPPSGPPPRPMPPPSRTLPAPVNQPPEPEQEHLEDLTVSVGQTFEMELSARPQPGHIWRVDSGLVTLAGQRFDDEKGVYLLSILAEKSGIETVRLIFGKPWGGHESETRTFHVTVR